MRLDSLRWLLLLLRLLLLLLLEYLLDGSHDSGRHKGI
jgi:hypothetical protein